MKYLIIGLTPITLLIIAGYMVYADKPYYGWVIVVALLSGGSITESKDDRVK